MSTDFYADDATAAAPPGEVDVVARRRPEGFDLTVTVRRNLLLHLALGAIAGVQAVAFLGRGDGFLDIVLGLLMLIIAALQGFALAAGRMPVLVADDQGLRFRVGLGWQGLTWADIRQVVVERAENPWQESRLVVVPRTRRWGGATADVALHRTWNRRWFGAEIAVPLGFGVLVDSPQLARDLRSLADGRTDVAELRGRRLAAVLEPEQSYEADFSDAQWIAELGPAGEPGNTEVSEHAEVRESAEVAETAAPAESSVVAELPEYPEHSEYPEHPEYAEGSEQPVAQPDELAVGSPTGEAAVDEAYVELPPPPEDDDLPWEPPVERIVAEQPPLLRALTEPEAAAPDADAAPVLSEAVRAVPLRPVRRVVRAEVRLERPADDAAVTAMTPPVVEPAVADHEAQVPPQRSPQEIAALLAGVSAPADPTGEASPATASGAVIGAKIAHAREVLDMSLEELSERTRIRPHVLEAIEVDDFEPCGGDVYARGHLSAVARVLGLDAAALIDHYDQRYAQGPIDARRVFEADLGGGGSFRTGFGGPRWSLLISAVLCLAMVWGLARLFTGDETQYSAAPDQAGVAVQAANRKPITSPLMKVTTVTVSARYAPTRVVVRDRTGKVIWSGELGLGRQRKVAGSAPFTVKADNAGAVEISIGGRALGTVGPAGEPGVKKFG